MFIDKTLLITGGTGTFDNTVLRRFFKHQNQQPRYLCGYN